MTPDATRNLLLRRRELTGETFNDQTVSSWHKLLEHIDYPDAVNALTQAATQHERINARHLHEHLPSTSRPPTPSPTRDQGCDCRGAEPGLPQGRICEMHRRTGLDAIARIRAQRTARPTGGTL